MHTNNTTPFNKTDSNKNSNEAQVANFFSMLSDETRLKILLAVSEKPKAVNDIHCCVGKDRITLSGVSHQLKHLTNCGILMYEKNGKEKKYHLSNNFCWCILKDAFKHFKNKK
ncbi:winged helix-turn-helix transcriptional regulator [Candidatus Woesearchaeota archaeon]|nr:winged helix-turn-helix transcriptional regulator [Candidatus Woesearchaeota archaeon]